MEFNGTILRAYAYVLVHHLLTFDPACAHTIHGSSQKDRRKDNPTCRNDVQSVFNVIGLSLSMYIDRLVIDKNDCAGSRLLRY